MIDKPTNCWTSDDACLARSEGWNLFTAIPVDDTEEVIEIKKLDEDTEDGGVFHTDDEAIAFVAQQEIYCSHHIKALLLHGARTDRDVYVPPGIMRLYFCRVFSEAPTGEREHIADCAVWADDEADATPKAIEDCWDDRLDATDVSPVVVFVSDAQLDASRNATRGA